MAEEKKGPQFVDDNGKSYPAVPVAVKSGDTITSDLVLEDGSTIKLRVIVVGVWRADGATDALGQPVYHVQTVVLPTVQGAAPKGGG